MSEKPRYEELEQKIKELENKVAELRLDNERFSAAIHTSPVPTAQGVIDRMFDAFALHEIICDGRGKPVDYRFLAVNPAFERMTGLKGNDILGRTVLEVLPGTEPYWIATYGEVAVTGEPALFENYSAELKKHFQVSVFCPGPNRFGCIFVDITTRKRAEEKLRENDARLRAILEAFPGMLNAVDSNYNIICASRKLVESVGLHHLEDAVGGKCYRVWKKRDAICPECGVVDVLAAGQPFVRHCTLDEAKLTGMRSDLHISPILCKDGRVIGAVEIMLDMSARLQTEEALRESEQWMSLAIEGTGAGLWDWDVQTGKTVFNERWAEMLGYRLTEFEPTSIGTWKDLCHPNDLPLSLERIEAHVAGVTDRYECDIRMRHKDGHWVWVQDRGKVVAWDADGRPLRMCGTHLDFSARKSLEQKRLMMEITLQKLQKSESLGRMAGAIAHHFNNQLQAVMGYLELAMGDSSGNTAVREDLTEAMKAARRAAEVSGLMLVYLGQKTGKRALMDLSEACGSGLPLLQAVMPKNILMETDLPSPGPAIRANANQIQQVLTNLVTNAWESMPEGGGAIRLTVKTVSAEDTPKSHRFPIDWRPRDESYACLEVGDTGCGIEEQNMENLFDPFFSTKFTGRGLGLPVVVGIAGAHGGLVTVESGVGGRKSEDGGEGSEGRGSVFRVFFPLSLEEVIRQPEKPKEVSAVAGNGTALVIDDEPQVRELTASMIGRLGFTVLEAGNGAEGVEIFKAHPGEIRCVICDLSMPRMDGWETLSALRKLSPGIPVILASGYDEASVMTGDHPEWPQAFLSKPYGFQDLRDAIGRDLGFREVAGRTTGVKGAG